MLGKPRCKIAVAVRELLNRTRRRLMKFGEMLYQLKAGSEFVVKGVGVITYNVQAAAFVTARAEWLFTRDAPLPDNGCCDKLDSVGVD